MTNKKIGLCVTGSFCTFSKLLPEIQSLKDKGNDLYPIFSYSVAQTDTRFNNAKEFFDKVAAICGRPPVVTLPGAEPYGPVEKMDVMIIAPCTGNTLSKLNHAITDTPVLLAAKAHLRNGRPLLLAVATNDGLSGNARNIGDLLYKKNIFFVPFSQDNYTDKEYSLVAHFELIEAAADMAVEKKQLQPVIRSK